MDSLNYQETIIVDKALKSCDPDMIKRMRYQPKPGEAGWVRRLHNDKPRSPEHYKHYYADVEVVRHGPWYMILGADGKWAPEYCDDRGVPIRYATMWDAQAAIDKTYDPDELATLDEAQKNREWDELTKQSP